MMLADMRDQGTTDAKLQELVTQENYERYKKISRKMIVNEIKGNIAVRGVGQQQGLSVSQAEVDDEVPSGVARPPRRQLAQQRRGGPGRGSQHSCCASVASSQA